VDKPHENPYSDMTDGELDSVRREALSAYAERLDYLASLPTWMVDEFAAIAERGPAAFGLAPGEWEQLACDLWQHVVDGRVLGSIRQERGRRLSETARARVTSCPTWEQARAIAGSYGPPAAADALRRRDGESTLELVLRVESWHDAADERRGAVMGEADAYRRHMDGLSAASTARWLSSKGGARR
jgi:hypothetical protein